MIFDNRLFSVQLGGGKSVAMNAGKTRLYVNNGGRIIFKGQAAISEGTVLRCDENTSIEIGAGFYCNCNCYLRSSKLISFGERCILGWNVTINTSDGHQVTYNGRKMDGNGTITIGNKVWLAPDCSLTKNVVIPDNCIVTQKAVVTKAFSKPYCMIGGIPAEVIRENINWE